MKKGLSKKLACLVTLITVTSNTIAFAQDINKDETVYVILDENGNPTEQIVSDWIKGSENLGKFSDKSTLSDIKNVKGEEEPVKNGDELTWEVNSKELYYQGKSNNKLPITVWVDYEFNGKKVNPNEVLGQKGNFKISVNITNNESKTTFIKGEKRTLYLPILTAAEITLSNTKFSNLKVTSGKVMDDGNNSLVTFVTIPGLKESLKIGDLLDDLLDGSTVDLSSSFEITGDTDNFEIPAIMLFASTTSGEIDDIEGTDSFDDLRNSLNDLQKGGEDLLSGSKELLNGQTELSNNYSIFNNGVSTLNSGAIELKNGINTLNSKVPTLINGVNTLNSGAGELKSSYSKFDEGVSRLARGANSLNEGANTLSEKVPTLIDGVNTLNDGAGELKSNYLKFDEGVSTIATGANSLNEGVNNLNEKVPQLNNGAEKLNSGVNQLQGNYTEFDKGISNLALGANSLNSGVNSLKDGSSQLNNGTVELNQGLSNLNDKYQNEFLPGINQLLDGSNNLNNNYKTINNGIESSLEGATNLNNGLKEIGGGIKNIQGTTSQLSDIANQIFQIADKLNEVDREQATALKNYSQEILKISQGQSGGLNEIAQAIESSNTGASK